MGGRCIAVKPFGVCCRRDKHFENFSGSFRWAGLMPRCSRISKAASYPPLRPQCACQYLIMTFPSRSLLCWLLKPGAAGRADRDSCYISLPCSMVARGMARCYSPLLIYFLYTAAKLTLLCFGAFALLCPCAASTVVTRLQASATLPTPRPPTAHIWMGSLNMARRAAIRPRLGHGRVCRRYPQYALGGIEAAPHSHNLYCK